VFVRRLYRQRGILPFYAQRDVERGYRVVCQMADELSHRGEALSTRRTTGYNDALTTFGNRRRLIDDVRKIVTVNFRVPFASVAIQQL
jgi:hypothetical protein